MSTTPRIKTEAGTAARLCWEDLDTDRPMERLSRERIIGSHMMISRITLETGCVVPTHAHANEQMVCVMSGRLRFGIGADGSPERRNIDIGPGEVLHLPPDVPHGVVKVLERAIVLDLFSPTSEATGIDGPRGH
jgi:quercetin dioxygenase-like cupin family protein